MLIFFKMDKTKNKALIEEIEIPEGINAFVDKDEIILKKGESQLQKKIDSKLKIKIENNKITLECEKNKKNQRKIFRSAIAHVKNMIKGLNEKFRYRLQISSVHFPVSVIINKEKNELLIKNFLGEKKDRKVKIFPGIEIRINKDIIEVESSDIEKAGQFAANIEKKTKIRKKDRRVFQDGVYIVSKPGKEYL